MNQALYILFALSVMYTSDSIAFSEYEDDVLNNLYKRWTSVQNVSGHELTATYLSPQMINRWYKNETEIDSKKRIGDLKKTIEKDGYLVYLIKINVGGDTESIIINNIQQSFSLGIAEPNAKPRKPDAYSPNLQTELFGRWDTKRYKTYYGVMAFKIGHDKFSFQTLSFSAIEGQYRCCGQFRMWKDRDSEHPLHVQFSFLPNGVPKEARLSERTKVETPDIINILSLAVDIVSLISPLKVLR